jgi:hypothetical protein
LHRIVCLGQRTQHPVRDRTQAHPLLFEAVGKPLLFIHGHLMDPTRQAREM